MHGMPSTQAAPGSELTPKALQRSDERDQVATIASLRPLLRPRSVAVIGASRERASIGGEALRNLLSSSRT